MKGDVHWHVSEVARSQRERVTGGQGATVWLTGFSGSGKSTIAYRCEAVLISEGRAAYTLDGDNIRHGLNAGLGFTPDDRKENMRRVGEVALLMADAGLVVFAPLISPYAIDRDRARFTHEEAGIPFYEVHVATPLSVCEDRDTKGLYARARTGEIEGFTGISAPYEAPTGAEARIDTVTMSIDESVSTVLALVR